MTEDEARKIASKIRDMARADDTRWDGHYSDADREEQKLVELLKPVITWAPTKADKGDEDGA